VIGKSRRDHFRGTDPAAADPLRHGLSSRALLDDPVLLKRLEANAILHLNSISGTTGALLAGLGLRDRDQLFAREQLEAGSLIAREVVEPTLTRTLYLCRLRNRPMTTRWKRCAG